MKYIRKSAFAFVAVFLLVGMGGCKKSSTSANNVKFSLDGAPPLVVAEEIRPGYDFLGGSNCEFEFDRLAALSSRGETEVGLFVNSDCNIVKGSLPYKTAAFEFDIITYPDLGPAVTYSYPYTGIPGMDSLGSLTLTITGRSSNRVQGTVAGIIYQSNIGHADSVTLDCTFDLNMPVK